MHYLLHKPTGIVTTAHDPFGRPTVLELVPDDPRVFPVGRLDADSEGLLVLTNDGALAQRLTHPSFGVEKEYLVEVDGVPSAGDLRRLRQGVDLDDGKTAPATVGVVAPGVIRIVIHEGRNRQIRRMCDAVGHPVRRLVRTRIGPLSDPRLKPGGWRALDAAEVRAARRGARRRRRTASRPPGQRVGAPAAAVGSIRPHVTCPRLRGATTVDADTPDQVSGRMQELLGDLLERNGVAHDDVISIVFTATGDVVSMFPAAAARTMGLGDVPLLCARELDIVGSTPRCSAGARPPATEGPGPSSTTSTSTGPEGCAMTSPS